MRPDEQALELFHRLRRFSMAFEQRRGEFARLHGLHPTDLRALVTLLDAGRADRRATPGWLGAQLGLNSAGVTTLIDRLERLGFVRRLRDTRDRRQVFVEVAPSAVDLGWSFFGSLIGATAEQAKSFSEAELAVVRRFLDAVIDVAENQRHEEGARPAHPRPPR